MSGLPYFAKALFDYTAVEDTELSVTKGDFLTIEEINDTGWCLAKIGDRAGWVPQDYVEKIKDDAAGAATSSAPAATSAPANESIPSVNEALNSLAAASEDFNRAKASEGKADGTDKKCHMCKKAISSAFVVAKDFTFHSECFKCVACSKQLGGQPFIEKDEQFYCEDDYYTSFNPKCGHCGETIKGQYISALNKSWHPDHFVCTICSKPFDGSQFRKHDDKPYCDEHFLELFATPCAKCGQNITGQVFEAVGKKFHLECFTCEVGGHKIGESMNFHVQDGKIYCPSHFEELVLNKCAGCSKLIRGQYIKIMDSFYHPECWKCSDCSTVLSASSCAQTQGKWYCKTCFAKTKAGQAPSKSESDGADEAKAKAALAKIQADKEARATAERDAQRALEEQKKKREADIEAAKAGKLDSPVSPGFSLSIVSYDVLVTDKLPANVDPSRKELYLADNVFADKFKMSKAEFAKLPGWKQQKVKKDLRLF